MKLRMPLALSSAAVLALGVAACGEEENTSSASGSGSGSGQTSTPAADTKPVAQIDEVTGESTAVTLDTGFLEALTSLKVTPGPLGDAEISKEGVATFPITGGNVTYYKPGTVRPFVQGELQHDGSGLTLEAGGKKVELADFNVDPGASVLTGKVSVDGEVAAESAPLFFLDGRTLNPLETQGSQAILEGTTVKLKAEAADLLNQTFEIDALKEGLVIGVAKITLDVPAS